MPMYEEEFLVFKSPIDDRRVKISTTVLKVFSEHIQIKNFHNEAGGILMGRQIKNSLNVVIDEISIPQLKDHRTRFTFFRHFLGHQSIINTLWTQSKGTCNYLGEWHTHPQAIPIPSSVDLKSWDKLANDVKSEFNFLLFIILGYQELCVYELNRTDKSLTKLIWEKTDENL